MRRIVKITMGYQRLESRGLISSELAEAIEHEEEISDLLFTGLACDAPELMPVYRRAEQLSEPLNLTEKTILMGVGLKLWQERIAAKALTPRDEELQHALCKNQQYKDMIAQSLSEWDRTIALTIIDKLHIPTALHDVAA